MARFLIEVPHSPEPQACTRAVDALFATGSHFITHADLGCLDGEHKAWMIVDAEGKEDARRIVPPAFRREAKIVQVTRFSLEGAEDLIRAHHREQVA
jgi:hypothetical protein